MERIREKEANDEEEASRWKRWEKIILVRPTNAAVMEEHLSKSALHGGVDDLYLKLKPQITRYGAYMLGSLDAGEDICQEVFLIYSQQRQKYQGKASLETYLFGITKNVCRNLIRKKRREAKKRGHAVIEYETSNDPNLSFEKPEEELKEKKKMLNQALSYLDPKFRDPLLLYTMESFSYSKVAEMLDLSEGTVKSRIHAAKEKLTKIIDLIQQGKPHG